MIDTHAPVTNSISIPFHLDHTLGPNIAHIMLVMCEFELSFVGTFTVEITDTTFQIVDVDLTCELFELRFPDEFVATISALRVSRRANSISNGQLWRSNDVIHVHCDVPLTIHMDVVMPQTTSSVTFHPSLRVEGTIENEALHLQGTFDFLLESYSDPQMKPKFGICSIWLSATSHLYAKVIDTTVDLTFANRTQQLAATGGFRIGLDGLEIQILDLQLHATQYDVIESIQLTDIIVTLASEKQPSVKTTVQHGGYYEITASIPVKLEASIQLLSSQPQMLNAEMLLTLKGQVALHRDVYLTLHDQLEVFVGDGSIILEVDASITAKLVPMNTDDVPMNERRQMLRYIAVEAEQSDLVATLQSSDKTQRWLALRMLAQYSDSTSTIIPILKDESTDVRIAAMKLLQEKSDTIKDTDLSLQVTASTEARERIAMLSLLNSIRSIDYKWLLLIASDDPDSVVRAKSVELIATHQSHDVLRQIARTDDNPFVRLSAASVLLSQIPTDEIVAEVLDLIGKEQDICLLMIASLTLGLTRNAKFKVVLARLQWVTDDPFVTEATRYALMRYPAYGGQND